MQNGDSIVGEGWYYELIVVPNPTNNNTYYLFSVGVTNSGDQGLYYSQVDMSQNGGLGSVVQKNIMLLSDPSSDNIFAIKHGNGRDWWIFFRKGTTPINEYYSFLISPFGIQGPYIQTIGSASNSNVLRQVFSPKGDKLLSVNYAGLLELYNFDRCTGVISNPVTIQPETCCPYPHYVSASFSPNGNIIYVCNNDQDSCFLFQFDLTAPNILNSKDTVYIFTNPPSFYPLGVIKLAPDGKIYAATGYYNGVQNFYPYADSMYNYINMNLSVINYPDLLGSSCDFQPFSFSLGGKRAYYGLPNNPDYELGPDTGSVCDTVIFIGTNEIQKEKSTLNIFYHSGWQTAFINAQGLYGKNYSLQLFDLTGRNIYSEQGKLSSEYFTKDLRCNFANGIYIISLSTERKNLTGRFIIQ